MLKLLPPPSLKHLPVLPLHCCLQFRCLLSTADCQQSVAPEFVEVPRIAPSTQPRVAASEDCWK